MEHRIPSVDVTRADFLKLTAAGMLSAVMPQPAAAATGAMMSHPIPKSKTGERLPIVGLGTAQTFGDRGDAASVAAKGEVVKALVAGGGKVLDTSDDYADGGAEDLCGEFMDTMKLRDKIFLATKVGVRGKENGISTIERSFKRLRTNMIDLMFVHNMIDVETQLPTLKDYKAQGRFRYVGVTSTGPNQDKLTTWMSDLDFIECAYAVNAREAEARLLPAAQDKGVAVLVALPLGRGRALARMKGKDVPAWAKEELNCTSYAQLLLKFAASHPAVTAVIPGTNDPKHMLDNLMAGGAPMPDAKQRERIAALWRDA